MNNSRRNTTQQNVAQILVIFLGLIAAAIGAFLLCIVLVLTPSNTTNAHQRPIGDLFFDWFTAMPYILCPATLTVLGLTFAIANLRERLRSRVEQLDEN